MPISGSPTPFLVCAVYLQFGVVGPGLFEQSAPEVSFEALKLAQGPAKNLVCRQIRVVEILV